MNLNIWKWSLGLVLVIGLIIATNLIDKRNYDQLSGALETIYSDRLIAKNLIFDMSNLVHEKSIAIALNDSTFYLKRNIEINDRMNNLLDDYAHTSLTTNESAEFETLKRDISKLIQIENKVNEATTNRESIVVLHAKILADLEKLSTIQIEEGKNKCWLADRPQGLSIYSPKLRFICSSF